MSNLIPSVPEMLYKNNRWIHWIYGEKDGKQTKIPVSPQGKWISTQESGYWLEYEAAKQISSQNKLFVGWVLGNGIGGIDLDYALDADGNVREWAKPIIDKFAGKTYCETSPSGRGVKLWVSGRFPRDGSRLFDADGYAVRSHQQKDHAIEVYNADRNERYFTVTERLFNGSQTVVSECQDEIDWLWKTYINKPLTGSKPSATEDVFESAPIAAQSIRERGLTDDDMKVRAEVFTFDKQLANDYWKPFEEGTRSEQFFKFVARFAEFSADAEQCRRLVYSTELCRGNGGKRYTRADKADFFRLSYDKVKRDLSERDRTTAEKADKIRQERQATPQKPLQRRLKIEKMSSIQEETAQWLWDRIIPLGGLTVVAGEGESGKSNLVSDIAARITRGLDFPDGAKGGAPADVLYVGVEEDVKCVLRPRLRKFGADLDRVHYAYGITEQVNGREIVVPWKFEELVLLRESLEDNRNIKMVVFDPIGCYFGQSDSYKDSEIQALLQPLSKMGQDLGVTMVAIAHLGKNETRSIKNRILGSVAIPNTARTVIGVIRDKANQQSYMGVCKSNFNSKRKSLPYTIKDDELTFASELDTDIDTMLKVAAGDSGRNADTRGVAEQIIQRELASGPKTAAEVKAACEAAGCGEKSAERAAKLLGVQSVRKGFPSYTEWAMPGWDDVPF